ncbi:hypothetical protein Bca52824_019787 [Brassica carinata]|uniref:TF-B3 domain-containing protein n=1 Tax=Brassica carinata TaxID=52824 RepID=A0A8X7VTR0_BRACI|nr:hypothetical protein Bca52824_019787 [Brassica carinata]
MGNCHSASAEQLDPISAMSGDISIPRLEGVGMAVVVKRFYMFKDLDQDLQDWLVRRKPVSIADISPLLKFCSIWISTQEFAASASSSASASGATQGYAPALDVLSPEKYLFNPNNPYFVKTLTKKIDVLYVGLPVIEKYGLNFGPHNSPMYYIIRNQKHDALTKIYGRNPCFSGWAALCKKYNLKSGDSVVCELERSGGVVTAIRIHFVNE